jgi:hypothetical protein
MQSRTTSAGRQIADYDAPAALMNEIRAWLDGLAPR